MKAVFSLSDINPNFSIFDEDRWISNELNAKYKIEDQSHLLDFIQRYKLNDFTIVDFGGSLGFGYLYIKGKVAFQKYYIVDVSKVCEVGRNNFPKEERLFFNTNIPNIDNIDLLYCRTALQYAEDWQITLEKLLTLNAKYIFLCHLAAGNMPTFVASQKYYGENVPYWFINIDEMNCIFEKHGYKLMINCKCTTFPRELYDKAILSENRISHSVDLAYERIE